MKVTLQIPVQVHDGSIRLYRKSNVHMNVSPHPGLSLAGQGLPDVLNLGPGHQAKNIVRDVGEDLESGEVFVTVHGLQTPAYTATEFCAILGEGWELIDEPIAEAPSPGGDTEAPPAPPFGHN